MEAFRKLSQIQTAIRQGQLSYEQLVGGYLQRISASRQLNIYLEVFEEEALEQARRLDQKLAGSPENMGRLFGAVISLKDVICYAGHRVEASSAILNGFRSTFSATAVERLLAEDAVVIGRVNCDEFAMGSSNEHSVHGPCRNPLDPARVPGGSSGGSAASVAADTCLLSLGSDTGGSVRQPASFCGVLGLKPTYGRVSRHGLIAYASSFDQIGLLAHSAEDAALALEIIAGPDEYDATVLPDPVPPFRQGIEDPGSLKIGWLQLDDAARPAARVLEEGRQRLAGLGHRLEPVSLPQLRYLVPAYYIMTMAEASSNLSRYDGIRYGSRAGEADSLDEMYIRTRTEGFGPEVKRRIMLGTFVLSSGYYDAYYRKAQQVRRLLKDALDEILSSCDLLILPTTPGPAWAIGEKSDDPVEEYQADIYTVMANMAGLPAISVPLSTSVEGLPMGLQLIAPALEEGRLFKVARQLEAD